jgi:hypothetical protein
MTDADIVARVHAWIARRQTSGWAAEHTERMAAIAWWLEVSRRYAADSPPALGCLVNLVRVAWDEMTLFTEAVVHTDVYGVPLADPKWQVAREDGSTFSAAAHTNEVDALVSALEAAP